MGLHARRWWAFTLVGVALAGAAELALRARYRRRVLPRTPPAPGALTIVALGDSIVAGAPGAQLDAWPVLLAAHLRAHFPAIRWHVVNGGVSGDTAPLGFARFDADVAPAGPDAVLIAFGLNDCHPARHGLDRWREGQTPAGLARSYLWRAVRVRLGRMARRGARVLNLPALAAVSPTAEPRWQPFPRTSHAGFAAALAALVGRARALGARPVLLTMTPLGSIDAEGVRARAAFYPAYNAAIRELAIDQGVPLVELAADAPSIAFEPDGFHLTAAGQAWVAQQVFSQLQAVGFWADLP